MYYGETEADSSSLYRPWEQSEAARQNGCKRKTINETINKLKSRYTIQFRNRGYQPEGEIFEPIDGHYVKGETALVNNQGVTQLKWVKTDTDQQLRRELILAAIDKAMDKYTGKSKYVPELQVTENDIFCFIPIGDAHIGMLAWGLESGSDFDLKIAERDLMTASARLIESLPACKVCVIADMGDYYHRNSNKNRTEKSGFDLDVDGRFEKMLEVGIDVMLNMIDTALHKFEQVIVRNIVGNHSPEAEQTMRVWLKKFYKNNPRVRIEDSPSKFWYYQFGKVLIGAHHGDSIKHNELPMIMAADVPQLWGDTLFRYMWIGHIHHSTVKEYQGCTVESVNNLAPNDAHHQAIGYRARKNLQGIVYHRDYGLIERIVKDISYIRDCQKGIDKLKNAK